MEAQRNPEGSGGEGRRPGPKQTPRAALGWEAQPGRAPADTTARTGQTAQTDRKAAHSKARHGQRGRAGGAAPGSPSFSAQEPGGLLLSPHPSRRCPVGALPSPLRRRWLGQPQPSHNSTYSSQAPSSTLLYQSVVVELLMHPASPRCAAVLR